MRKLKKQIKRPKRPWDKERIENEKKILKKYGLRRKREIWKAESILREYRRRARELAAKKDKEGEKILIEKLNRLGLLEKNAGLDDVLSLTLENILDRRLQTIVFKKGLANTPKQARQFIVHGHIAVEGKRDIFPSHLIEKDIEDKIDYYGTPPLKTTKKVRNK
ncbi:MAG: 30S ribosomal protein S4 [Candidatus Aenigmarchaeota archaeon]|nr:30S ribosomal protein S4 [Candidatus Aenigmarchaeota archaeon]